MVPRSVAVLALPGVQLLDVAGPLDVFAEANAQSGCEIYALAVVGTEPGHITTSSGRGLVADLVAPDAGPTRFDPTRPLAVSVRSFKADLTEACPEWETMIITAPESGDAAFARSRH